MPDHPDAPDDATMPAPNDDARTPPSDASNSDSPKFGEPGGEPPAELDQGPLVA